jgi:hypothetical protein
MLIAPELLMDFLKHPTPPGLTCTGIPDDARIVNARWRPSDLIELTIESASFAPLKRAIDPPVLEPRFHRLAPGTPN